MRVRAAGTTFEVSESGSGPAVVLVHAGVADLRMWDAVAQRLPSRRVLRYDLRGFGKTEPGTGEFSHDRDLLALLDACTVESCTLVGASFGGLVALAAALQAPERVERLVLCPPLYEHDWSPAFAAFGDAEEAAMEAGDLDRAVQLNVDLWTGTLDQEGRALVAAMQRRAFELQAGADGLEEVELDAPEPERLAALDLPVHLMAGDADLPDFPAIAEHLASLLPRAELEIVPGAGHLLAMERPELVAAAIG